MDKQGRDLASLRTASPVCVPLPKPGGRCPITMLSRSAMVRLAVPCLENNWRAPVLSYNIRLPGKKRGTRRVDLESLHQFLESCQEGGESV
jgi:hypothetical protein